MNIDRVSIKQQSFKAKIHPNTIKQAGREIIEIAEKTDDKAAEIPFRTLKDAIEILDKHGDKETTFAMYFPKEKYFIVSNPKLGNVQCKFKINEFINDNSIVNAIQYLLKSAKDKFIKLKYVSGINASGEKVKEAEGQLFNEYLSEQSALGKKPMQVIQSLRKEGKFDDEYIGENGFFTNIAYKRENLQDKTLIKLKENREAFKKSVEEFIKAITEA